MRKSRLGSRGRLGGAVMLVVVAGVTACGSFSSSSDPTPTPTADASDTIDASAPPSDAPTGDADGPVANDAATDAGDGAPPCMDVLASLVETSSTGGTVMVGGVGADTVISVAATTAASTSVVRAQATIPVPANALAVRLDATYDVSYVWNGANTTWGDAAYAGVLGILGGTTYGNSPQTSISIGGGVQQLNVFPDGTDVPATQRTAPAGTMAVGGGPVTIHLRIGYLLPGAATANGTAPTAPLNAALIGNVGPRPNPSLVVYVGGGAGGGVAPPLTFTFHSLCVVFEH